MSFEYRYQLPGEISIEAVQTALGSANIIPSSMFILGNLLNIGFTTELTSDQQEAVVTAIDQAELVDYKIRKVFELESSAQNAIQAGFVSSALGAPHLYDGNLEDQLNLLGTAMVSSSTSQSKFYACWDELGEKDYRLHSPLEISKVVSDGADFKLMVLYHLALLKAQVNAATTEEEVESITWAT